MFMSIFYSIASRGWIANQIKGLAAIKEGNDKIWVFDGEMQCSKANKGKVACASGKNLIADERRGSKDRVIAHDRVIGADITLRRPGEKSCRGLADERG